METLKTSKANLENKRFIFWEVGLVIALLLIFFAFRLKIDPPSKNITSNYYSSQIAEEMVPVTTQERKQVPPPPTKKISIIHIVENDKDVETDLQINVEVDQDTEIEEYIPFVPEEEEEVLEEEQIFVIVESMPSFPGGYEEMMKYLRDNIRYPNLAKESGIQGRVFVAFVVETDGSVTDVQILRGIGGGCDEEAIRVVDNMPRWEPGKQRNITVRVRFNLPIKFTLQ